MNEPTPLFNQLVLRGGYLCAGALLVRRMALLVTSGWSAWDSPGSLLHTVLDILAAAALLLLIIPLRRGATPPQKRAIYVIALAVIKLSWSIYDFTAVEPLFAVIDVIIAALVVAASIGAWRLTVWRLNYEEETDVETDEERESPADDNTER